MSGGERALTQVLAPLYEALAPLRLYRLRENSLIDRELAAYGAAFLVAEQLLSDAARQAFVQTADSDVLARYEELVGLAPRDGMDVDARRLLVLYRLGAAPFDFHYEGMVNSVRATGMEAEIVENPAGESILVRCLGIVDASLDLDAMKRSVRAVLPAHLICEFEMGELTWDLFDGSAIDWDSFDNTGMTWGDFDLNGHKWLDV